MAGKSVADDPYHAGEIAVQELTGEREAAVFNGSNISATIPLPAVGFVTAQELVVLSRKNAEGELWGQVVFGPKGFASVTSDRATLQLDLGSETPFATPEGPLEGLRIEDRLGGLFIEFATRRRLRVNGTIAAMEHGRLELAIAEAYPACPKYIQRRTPTGTPIDHRQAAQETIASGVELNADLRDWIEAADTLFVASGNPNGELDVSHRGGEPGFVRIVDGVLRVPDYPGNSMFNTLGNLTLDPRAGMVVPDFATGRQLAMTGTVELDLDAAWADRRDVTGGTGRWWTFRPSRWCKITSQVGRYWGEVDRSPFNPPSQADAEAIP